MGTNFISRGPEMISFQIKLLLLNRININIPNMLIQALSIISVASVH